MKASDLQAAHAAKAPEAAARPDHHSGQATGPGTSQGAGREDAVSADEHAAVSAELVHQRERCQQLQGQVEEMQEELEDMQSQVGHISCYDQITCAHYCLVSSQLKQLEWGA